jgi:hypothetical protein
MRRHRDGDISDLVRNTIIWIGVVIWLALSYIFQTPPGGAYEDVIRNAFIVMLAIVIPLTSAIIVIAWIGALRDRSKH